MVEENGGQHYTNEMYKQARERSSGGFYTKRERQGGNGANRNRTIHSSRAVLSLAPSSSRRGRAASIDSNRSIGNSSSSRFSSRSSSRISSRTGTVLALTLAAGGEGRVAAVIAIGTLFRAAAEAGAAVELVVGTEQY